MRPTSAWCERGATGGNPFPLSVVESFELLAIDRATASCYARLTRTLRGNGRLIGSNDLWIAAAALHRELPLVTADPDHFLRVPGLRVIGYR